MANNSRNSNNSAKRRRRNNNRSYRKDEFMDKVDKAFEESSRKNSKGRKYSNQKNNPSRSERKKEVPKRNDKFSIADENYFTEEIDRSLIAKKEEFYAPLENTFNEDEEKYLDEMEKVYGSRLKKEDNPPAEENISNNDLEVSTPLDGSSMEEEQPHKSQEEYFAEMEKIYGSRLEKNPEPVTSNTEEVQEEVTPPLEDTVEDSAAKDEGIDMSKKNTKEEKSTDVVEENDKEDNTQDEIEAFDTDIMSKIGDDLEADIKAYQYGTPVKENHAAYKNHKPNIFLVIVGALTFVCAIIYFIATLINSSSSILTIVSSSVLMLFTILFMVICITSRRKNILPMLGSCLLLLTFFAISLFNPVETVSVAGNKVQNFSGKKLTDVVKWANDNKIKITQQYEFSDMVPQYEIISQNVKVGTSVKDIDEIVVSVSDGPNPYKEIIVPSMLTWDSERVINFILTNHLSNVIVEFVDSDQVKDTVIEQSRSGNLKRNDELKLVFSYGDEGNGSDVTLINFTKMTQFEIEFFMKQHRLNYDFIYDFSDKAKKGYGMKQSVAAGTIVRVQGDKVQVTISKGPKIEIPDLSDMSVNEITEWAISKKLKLEFVDKYDDTIKYGNVISIDKEKGAIVEEGTVLKVTLSLGGLKMPKFKNVDAFYAWADKYGIKYETKHEFSDSVEAGQVIEYSYKSGQIIKNSEAITVTLSDGKKVEVPNLKGLTKNAAIKKLKAANLKYNFVYKSNDADKDSVLSQSISAGSEVSSDTTVTITLSSGRSNANNNTDDNKDNPPSSPSVEPNPSPVPACNSCTIDGGALKNIISQKVRSDSGYYGTANAIIAYIEGECQGIDVQVRSVQHTGLKAGMVAPANLCTKDCPGGSWSGGETNSCSTVRICLSDGTE